jgi:hypothetical protein
MLMLVFVTVFAAFTPKGEEALVNEVYDYTNLFRKSKGLGGLALDEKLNVKPKKAPDCFEQITALYVLSFV